MAPCRRRCVLPPPSGYRSLAVAAAQRASFQPVLCWGHRATPAGFSPGSALGSFGCSRLRACRHCWRCCALAPP
eukprot:10619576-Alexandrium_andersonii.AAC.1